MAQTADIIVIGGGIVGFATALECQKRRPDARVVVLEKEMRPAVHQSGRNSGVIHAGVYYAPDSFKACLCRAGVAATEAFCAEHGIPFITCGKLIVATDAREEADLAQLKARAEANGIPIDDVSADDIRKLEPHIEGRAGLLSTSTGIVDYGAIASKMADLFVDRGGEVVFGAQVTGGTLSTGVSVTTGGEVWTAAYMVACAGLQSDRLIASFGLEPGFRIIPFRGEYFKIQNQPPDLVRHLIYPVPDPERPFLGVHLTRKLSGGFTVGPNAVLAWDREGYGSRAPNLRDASETLRYPGFWRMAATHWRTALSETADSLSKRRYLKRVQRYCPRVGLADLEALTPGIRAQAVAPDGRLLDDFHFVKEGPALFVGNAPSPAATSAMPIAAHIADSLGI
ncbi:MAG: L-2-hydroxyglutarate oxidase [Pseudomonadota bacterium]